MKFSRLKILNVLVAFMLINALAGTQPAYAATVIVVDRADDTDISKCTDRANDCSLRGAINLANSYSSATITFAGDYTITISKQLPKVTSLITITGNGSPKTIIQASSATTNPSEFRIFEVSGNLSLNNLTVRNGRCNYTCNGGGILNYQGVLTVTNSVISGNNAINGAGIYNVGTLIVTNSVITGNTAVSNGGGIFHNGKQLTVTNSSISRNNAPSIGGGICNYTTASVISSKITGNNSNYGAGIYNLVAATVTKSTFSGNHAKIDGGGISSGGTLTVTGSTFSGNTSSRYGGGIILYFGQLILSNSTFSANSAVANGGALFNSGTMIVKSTTFSGNTAYSGAGFANGGKATVLYSTFSKNNAKSIGGGIRNSSNLVVTSSTFVGNTAASGGGAIYNRPEGLVSVINSTLSGNSSGTLGGGIYNDGKMAVTNSSFSGNSATTGGGGICNHGTVTMTNNTLSANKSANGGALYNYRGTLNLLNTILANSPTGFDCFNYLGIIGKNTNNLIETNGKCGTPVISSDPKLGPLANNGGSTLTFALLSGSPAIHKGSTAVCAAAPVNNKDQRGFIRSQDAACDIGAYELMH